MGLTGWEVASRKLGVSDMAIIKYMPLLHRRIVLEECSENQYKTGSGETQVA